MASKLTPLGCLLMIPIILAIIAATSLLTAAIIYYVWNLVISDVFTLKQITFLQSYWIGLGLSVVGSFFKSTIKTK